jgi:hypothetical protein
MIRAPFNRPFATREEIDYIRAATATPIACCVSIFQRNANGANLGDALRRAGTRQQLSGSPRFAQTRLKKFRRKILLS